MSTLAPDPVRKPQPLIGLLLPMVLDYFRWTQLVPMVFAWLFLVLMIVVMAAVNFQTQIDSGLVAAEERFEPWIERWVGPASNEEEEAEALNITWDDLHGTVFLAWGVLALLGSGLGALRAWLFGPRPAPRLGRKLVIAGAAAGLGAMLLLATWLFGSETYHGSPLFWAAMFTIGPLIVWVISAYSLSISYLVDLVQDRLSV